MSHFSWPQKIKPWKGSGKPVLAIPVPWEFRYGQSKRPNNPGKQLLFVPCSEHKHRQGPFPILLSVLSWSHYRFLGHFFSIVSHGTCSLQNVEASDADYFGAAMFPLKQSCMEIPLCLPTSKATGVCVWGVL